MTDLPPILSPEEDPDRPNVTSVHSLRELIDMVSGRNFRANLPQEDMGLAEPLPDRKSVV